jgi:peptidoglycan/LPS O-acetylase OafA/YrhL
MGSYGFPDARRVHTAIHLGDVAHFGVRVFFVISGFLITTLLVDEAKKSGGVSLGAFYARRAFRIFPPYYVYLLAMMVLGAVGWVEIPWPDAVRAFTYTVNYAPERVWYVGHAWSLSVEEQFYLVWPVVLRAAGMKRGAWIALGAVVLSPLVRVAWALVFSY